MTAPRPGTRARDPAPDASAADDPAPTPTPMVVEQSPPDHGSDIRSGTTRPGTGTRRTWTVVALVAVLATAGLLLATREPARPDVQYVDWYTGALATAPGAPDGPLQQRWSSPVPRDRELVGVDVVARTVVVVTRPRLGTGSGGAPEGSVVATGHDPVDGASVWRRTFEEARPAVVVLDDDQPVLVANMGDDGAVADRFVWDRTTVVALDPADGTTRWRHDFPDGDGTVRVRPDGAVVLGDGGGVAEVDGATGNQVLAWPAVTGPDEAPPQFARRYEHGWAVPLATGWQVADLDGQIEFAATDADGPPHVDETLAVVRSGTELVAHERPTGAIAWRVDLGGEARWLEQVTATTPTPSSWLVGVRGQGDDAPTIDPVVVRDGRVVDGSGPASALGGVTGERMGVVVDDRPLTLCRRLDTRASGSRPACPDQLALLDADDGVEARQPSIGTSDLDPSLTWQPTDLGVLTIERDVVRLSSWTGLSEVWTIPLERPILRPVRVATDAIGVAVARNDVGPARVTWYG